MWWLLYIILIPISCAVGLVGLFLAYLQVSYFRRKDYWPNKGVTFVHRKVFGNRIKGLLKPRTVMDFDMTLLQYCKQNNVHYVGGHEFSTPFFYCKDLDIIKQITVKDFGSFVNRRKLPFENTDPYICKMLFTMEGSPWKNLRTKLSPIFTTGKIKKMFKIYDSSAVHFVQYISNEISESDSGDFDLSVGYGKYTMDVIATAAFGIDSKTFEQKDSIFEQMGRKMGFKVSFGIIMKLLFTVALPKLAKSLGISLMDSEAVNFFAKAVTSVVRHRENSGEKNDDFIQLMLETRDGLHAKVEESELDTFEKDAILKLEEKAKIIFDNEIIVAQCILFLLAGFDTTTSLLLFAAYQLALCPEIQEKLAKEVESVWEESDGEFTYESINHMEYMEKVICETLRMFPPAARLDRRCNQPFNIPNTDVILEKDTLVYIPVYAIHHDEDNYPDPEKFDPERFSAENKAKRNMYSYLPFGAGPRNCIGMRFALTEVKVALAHFVRNFVVEPCEKTLIPMKFSNDATMKPIGGMWLKLKKRN